MFKNFNSLSYFCFSGIEPGTDNPSEVKSKSNEEEQCGSYRLFLLPNFCRHFALDVPLNDLLHPYFICHADRRFEIKFHLTAYR